jgi:hypothetical protein
MKNTNQKKATDEQIIESYNRLKSVWLVAEELAMSGQTVHERTMKLGIQKKMNKFTEEDDFFLKENYNDYLYKGKLQELADKMGRTKQFICRQAKRLGLTDIKRKKSLIEGYKPHIPDWNKKSHPKGMLGKKHTKETLDALSAISKNRHENMSDQQKSDKVLKMMKTREKNGNMVPERHKTTWKSGWRDIGGKRKYFRSRWEANYARYLEFLKQGNQILEWVHEPEVFWFEGIKRGCVSYLPDFKVTYIDNSVEYHEVKGWMDDRSKTKIKRMAKYHPAVVLKIIDAKWFKANNKMLTQIIFGWEV